MSWGHWGEGASSRRTYTKLLEATHLVILLVLHLDIGLRRYIIRRRLLDLLCSALPRHIAYLGCSPRAVWPIFSSSSPSIFSRVCSCEWASNLMVWTRWEGVIVAVDQFAVYSRRSGRIMCMALGASGTTLSPLWRPPTTPGIHYLRPPPLFRLPSSISTRFPGPQLDMNKKIAFFP